MGFERLLRLPSRHQYRRDGPGHRSGAPILLARRRQYGDADDQPVLRPARLAHAGAPHFARRRTPLDLPLERPRRSAARRSADAQAGALLAQPDVHGCGRVVRGVRDHRRLAIVSPAPLDAKADPNNTAFVPSPAWYFNALYALLEIVPEQYSLFATVIGPGIAVLVLLLLPWIDRNPSRQFRRRPVVLSITALAVFGAVFMSFYGQQTINAKAAAAHQVPPSVPGGAMANALEQSAPSSSAAPGGGGTNAAAIAAGQKIYTASCSSCHGATGAGVPGTFPPLAHNPAVTAADPKEIIHIVAYGRSGPLQVNGQTFNGQMPAWSGTLSNADIANVITFIRNSWGNSASAVSEAQVAAVKK